MSTGLSGIPTSRVSDLFIRQQMVTEMDAAQQQMTQTEQQLTTGYQFSSPSQNPIAAMQVVGLQSLIAQKTQVQTNITAAGTDLSETGSALSSAANLISQAQATAVGAIGATVTGAEQSAAADQIDQDIQQLMTIGNQNYDGRYLFAGSDTTTMPFSTTASGAIEYSGNNDSVSTYADLNTLFATNVSGQAAFGALSPPVQGANLQPALTYDTPLADLNQGAGIAMGSIAVSNGHSTSIVNLQGAQTIGDVAAMIQADPPAGSSLAVEVTGTGLVINLNPAVAGGPSAAGNLSISEVGGGTTAANLGILNQQGVGDGPLTGSSLNPALRTSTPLGNLLGTQAQGFVSLDAQSGIIVQADSNGTTAADGTLLNGITIHFQNDASAPGQESAQFDPGTPAAGGNPGTPGTLTVHVVLGSTTPQEIVAAINNAPGLPFQAQLNPTDSTPNMDQPIESLPADATTAGGSGTTLDQTSGLQLTNGGQTCTVSLSGDKTVQDLLNSIQQSGAGMLASINGTNTGINVQSRLSGTDFSIGENGGSTATQLGLRTFTAATPLADLNHGAGVGQLTAGATGPDFTISQPAQNIQLNVDMTGLTTVGQVCDQINQLAQAAGANITAQLNPVGNGIQLVDTVPGDGAITVAANPSSTAAADLGLIPAGQTQATSSTVSTSVGPWQMLTGTDVNPQTTGGVFDALMRLSQALQNNDNTAAQQAVTMLSNATSNLNNTQAEVGARQQGLDALQQQVQNQQLDLQQAMSSVYDTDMTQAASDLTAEQVTYEASLHAAASMLQLTLLNYL